MNKTTMNKPFAITFPIGVFLALGVGALTGEVQPWGQQQMAIAQNAGPAVTTKSTPATIALANHLRKVDAKLYVAYWCPYCHRQKELFGVEAVKRLQIIECDPKGVNPKPQLCRDKRITAYPSWEINGKIYRGGQTLLRLANLSGFKQ
ncbi:MAG: hypothetical protein NW214_06170 [Pseudanabaenaceae cyanobacterium bins.39]|nr:hypothetical protein [Pseudanabaenaceae cyanobacterium bins.39]